MVLAIQIILFIQPSSRDHFKKTHLAVYQDLMGVKVAVAVKSAVIPCVTSFVLRMQDAYEAFIWAYYSSLLLSVVDAVG